MPTKKTTKKVTAKKVAKKTTAKKAAPKAARAQAVKKTAAKKRPAAAKAATKKVAQKTTKKRAAPKRTAAAPKGTTKLLVCASDGHCFWTTDGQVLRDLHDLKVALGSMDEMVFLHHVSEDKNDFADWVEHVLHDPDCAAALRACPTPKKATSVVTTHLRYYTR